MLNRMYAILPEAAIRWERAKIDGLQRMPDINAQVSEERRAEIMEFFGMFVPQRRPTTVQNGVAVIHLHDFLASGLTFLERCLGATDYGDVLADVESVRTNPEVKSVLFDVDSGGGSAVGCVELGQAVSRLAAEKETAMFTDSLACSAAYCVGVGSATRYATPSAMVGSIGTILTFMDFENLLQSVGITPHIITSEGADLKASGNPYRHPTDAEMEHLQELADEYASQFVSHVWDNNQKIDADEGFRGQAVSGRQAVKMGFVDAVATRGEVIASLESWAAVS